MIKTMRKSNTGMRGGFNWLQVSTSHQRKPRRESGVGNWSRNHLGALAQLAHIQLPDHTGLGLPTLVSNEVKIPYSHALRPVQWRKFLSWESFFPDVSRLVWSWSELLYNRWHAAWERAGEETDSSEVRKQWWHSRGPRASKEWKVNS